MQSMTDEEKAEDRYCKTCKKKNNCFHNCDVFIEYTKGLAEGRKEGYEQGKNNEREFQCGKKNYEKDIAVLKAQIEKMKLDQKTVFDKGMKHLAKKLKEYDRINGGWTDYFEHTVNKVLKWELERKGRTEWEITERMEQGRK